MAFGVDVVWHLFTLPCRNVFYIIGSEVMVYPGVEVRNGLLYCALD